MANKSLFNTLRGALLPASNTYNEAGGAAYKRSDKQALATFAATGCLNSTFYASEFKQLQKVIQLCENVEPEFIAQTALYARRTAYMKDLPALLCAILSVKSPSLLAEVFDRVIDTPKMLRNFVQIMRSGAVGRKSLGALPKRLVLQWLESRNDEQLFMGSVGNDPSLVDVIKMVHPKPNSAERSALFGYFLGRDHDADLLPEKVRQFEKFKRNTNPGKVPTPDVPFQMLTSLKLTKNDWEQVARNATWQTTRMNLNTFMRHGVFEKQELISLVANRLRNPRLIEKSRVFPYQLMAAYMNANKDLPVSIRESLQDAMEIAIKNVPRIEGQVYVFPDISGSMHSPVTGMRRGSSSKVRCIDVAALVAAAIVRKNRTAQVIPFESSIVNVDLNPRDSVMTNATKLSSLPCGGTNCSAPLVELNRRKAKGDVLVYVSDNESWIDSPYYGHFGGGATETMKQWSLFKRRNPQAKLVCIDMQPYDTSQTVERNDVINVAGFSDQVFQLLADVAIGQSNLDHWINTIEQTRI